MIKAIFIAPTRQQAACWANQWGYKNSEWRFIPHDGWEPLLDGWRFPDIPAYECGEEIVPDELLRALRRKGFRVYDAETICV